MEQLSDLARSHAAQASPPVPQVLKVEASHVAPAQQPLGQFNGVQPVQTPRVQA
jgi:hypothetical protein